MNKRVKKLAYLTAIIVCLAIGGQSTIPAAASTNGWKCGKCGTPTVLEVRPAILIGETEPMKCDFPDHWSVDCYVIRELLEDQYWVTCFTCGVSSRSGQSAPYSGDIIRHMSVARAPKQ